MSLVWKMKRGKSWYLYYSKSTGIKARSLRSGNANIAELIRTKEENDILLGRYNLKQFVADPIRYSALVKKFLEFKHSGGRSQNTIQAYTYALNNFGTYLSKDLKVHKITSSQVSGFASHRLSKKRKLKTIRNELTTLAIFFKYAKQNGYLINNPMTNIELPRKTKTNPPYMHIDEYQKLMESIDDEQFKTVIDFYILTGCRRNEGLAISISGHIDLQRKIISIPQQKTGDYKILPINDDLMTVIKKLISYSANDILIPYHSDFLTHKFKKYITKAQLRETLHFHSLRHTAATWLAQAGANPRSIQELLGHSDPATSEIYTHSKHLENDINKLRIPVSDVKVKNLESVE